MRFSLERDSKIIIYGAGGLGKRYYELFNDFFCVVAFLDRQVKNEGEFAVPVYCPETDEALKLKECPVFISFHDCSQHNSIAYSLWILGYHKILFFPMSVHGGGYNSIVRMRRIYRMLIEQDLRKQLHIPCYDEFLPDYKKEEIIRKNNRYVVVYASYEVLYTSVIDPNIQHKGRLKYSDVPLLSNHAYLGLFQYLYNGEYNEGAEEYKRVYGEIQKYSFAEDCIFENRYNLLMSLADEDSYDIADAPLEVQWNENGYFNVLDGQHRAAYYYLRGIRRIPVRMLRDDYKKLYDEKKVKSLLRIMKKNNINQVYTPIPYFGLYQFPSYRENQARTVLSCIQKFLHGQKINKAIDLSIYNSYFGRNMVRMKVSEVVSVETNQKEYELALSLNQLLKTESCTIKLKKERYDFEGQYDVAFILGSLLTEKRDCFLQQLDRAVYNMIIWESISHPEEERCYIMKNSKFKYYIPLGCFYLESQLKEVGVFLVSDSIQEDIDYEP